MTSSSGRPPQASASATSSAPGREARSCRSPRITASIRIIPILANSDGSIWNPPGSAIQECAPLTVAPSGLSTTSSPRQAAA